MTTVRFNLALEIDPLQKVQNILTLFVQTYLKQKITNMLAIFKISIICFIFVFGLKIIVRFLSAPEIATLGGSKYVRNIKSVDTVFYVVIFPD